MSETRTLLFSDIEGSTRLHLATGDEYANILGAHRKLIRDAVQAHNGLEHRTSGDGFFFVFRSARDALAAAVEAQVSLREHPWPNGQEVRVRMGLHAGEVGESDNDIVGIAINEAARIMDAANGRQILVSSVVAELTAGGCPPDVSLKSLGRYRLKDFDEPIELLHVRHPELPADLPPPRADGTTVTLPIPRTEFIGRQRELDAVADLVAANRHVTLTGVGGSGKTRLALAVAAKQASRYPDGAFFVDLAPLADPEQVLAAVATSVSVQGDATDVEEMLLSYLSSRRVLIVLDNCEHVVDAAADVVDLLLERCGGVSVLATSREALQIDGEQTFNVRSLGVDDESSEGVTLFVSRARGVKRDFAITDENRSDVLAICRRLDGIPLAIELAAARVDHMSIADIARRLDDRFELLIGGRRRRAQRQQTLQAAMDWSWALLREDERALMRALAVFAGPFVLDAAEAVSGSRRTLELLRSLVSKSLVDVVDGAVTRYRLLETVRLYAQERLVESGEAVARRDAHREWYLARAEEVPFDDFNDLRRVEAFLDDHANVRAAIDWTLDQDRRDLFARLVLATGVLWVSTMAKAEEGRRLLRMVADDERQPARARADAFEALGASAIVIGDIGGIRANVDRSLELDASERPVLAAVYWLAGRLPEAIALTERFGLPSFNRFLRAWAAGLRIGPDPEGALEELKGVIEQLPERTTAWDIFFALSGSALARIAVGDPEGALADVEALDVRAAIEYEAWFGSLARFPQVIQSLALADLGRFDEAHATIRDISRAALRDNYPLLDHDCLAAFAYISFREGDIERAARLLRPVVRAAAPRMAPMGSFIGRFLAILRHELAQAEIETDLPRTREYAMRAAEIFAGRAGPDPETRSEINRLLRELVER